MKKIFRTPLRALVVLSLAAGLTPLAGGIASATDGCVTTKVTYSFPPGSVVQVSVGNTCSYSLFNVDSHVFNGGGYDKRKPGVAELKPNHYFVYTDKFKHVGQTCGEIWTPPSKLWGRDCH
jgi:hypothetical protein